MGVLGAAPGEAMATRKVSDFLSPRFLRCYSRTILKHVFVRVRFVHLLVLLQMTSRLRCFVERSTTTTTTKPATRIVTFEFRKVLFVFVCVLATETCILSECIRTRACKITS